MIHVSFYTFVRFQKISIPTPRKVIRNSEEETGSKAKGFKECVKLNWNFKQGWGLGHGVGGAQTKQTFHSRGMDIFCDNTFS